MLKCHDEMSPRRYVRCFQDDRVGYRWLLELSVTGVQLHDYQHGLSAYQNRDQPRTAWAFFDDDPVQRDDPAGINIDDIFEAGLVCPIERHCRNVGTRVR